MLHWVLVHATASPKVPSGSDEDNGQATPGVPSSQLLLFTHSHSHALRLPFLQGVVLEFQHILQVSREVCCAGMSTSRMWLEQSAERGLVVDAARERKARLSIVEREAGTWEMLEEGRKGDMVEKRNFGDILEMDQKRGMETRQSDSKILN